MKRRYPGADAGFTLLEMIIAMTLLAILMLALSGSIGFVGRTWDKGWRAGERSGGLAQAEGIVRQLIEKSFPGVPDAQNRPHIIFRGNANGLRFIAYDAGSGARGYRLSELYVSVAGGSTRLVLRQGQFPATISNEGREMVLFQGDIVLDCAYYGALKAASPAAWHREWISDQRLPDLIQIRIRDGAAQIWPTILVHPMVDAEYACVSSNFPGACRLVGQSQ